MSCRLAATLLFSVSVSLALGGCATDKPAAAADFEQVRPQWEARLKKLSTIDAFSLQSRVAQSGVPGASGTLDWTEIGSHFEVRLSGPLGVGALLLSGEPRNVEVHTRDGIYQTTDPADFMQQQLGWSLPLEKLRWWVLGLPQPGTVPSVTLDEQGRALTLNQDGWQIEYVDYLPSHDVSLPHRMNLTDGTHSFRMVVDGWAGLSGVQ